MVLKFNVDACSLEGNNDLRGSFVEVDAVTVCAMFQRGCTKSLSKFGGYVRCTCISRRDYEIAEELSRLGAAV